MAGPCAARMAVLFGIREPRLSCLDPDLPEAAAGTSSAIDRIIASMRRKSGR